jgi:NAD(P)-dependent dehydrogenase (short-subunit alcohol dehydrogenase family)
MAPYDLSGKVALVTGAARGIGAAVALELLRAGAAVVAGVRLLSTADELEASLWKGR